MFNARAKKKKKALQPNYGVVRIQREVVDIKPDDMLDQYLRSSTHHPGDCRKPMRAAIFCQLPSWQEYKEFFLSTELWEVLLHVPVHNARQPQTTRNTPPKAFHSVQHASETHTHTGGEISLDTTVTYYTQL